VALVLATSALAAAAQDLPRDAPEFTIAQPDGTTTMLSSLKGRVVVMEFLFMRSEHCLRVAQTLNALQGELGAQGFQPIGIVFDPPNNRPTGTQLLSAMRSYFKLQFPLGYASKAAVDSFLARAPDQVLNIPQVVVIDRGGNIRAMSGSRGGDPNLEEVTSLRTVIERLLKEKG
jgi:peroxiredoxin